jgi:hypothetical protein
MSDTALVRRFLAALTLLGLLALGLGPAPARAQEGGSISIRLVDAPTDRRDDPRAQIYIVDHLHQGDRIERRIEIGNTTPAASEIKLYAAAASVREGRFEFGEGRAKNDLTSWTKVTPSTLNVPPGGTATATVTVDIPEDALDGERYAVVWAELPTSGGQAAVINRVGVRMYVSVGEGEEPTSDFRIETLTAGREKDGTPVVRTTVTNTGGRALDISGKMTLSDGPGGLRAGPFNVEVGTTLGLKERAPATVHLDKDLPNGPWKATVTIQSGELVKTAKATITFPDEPGATGKPVQAESVRKQRRVLIPIALTLVLALLVALFLLALRGRRRRDDERD